MPAPSRLFAPGVFDAESNPMKDDQQRKQEDTRVHMYRHARQSWTCSLQGAESIGMMLPAEPPNPRRNQDYSFKYFIRSFLLLFQRVCHCGSPSTAV
jgi:hypothetical protein